MSRDRVTRFAGFISTRAGEFPPPLCAASSNATELTVSTALQDFSLFVTFRLSEKLGLK
jgi:hypothetical protein